MENKKDNNLVSVLVVSYNAEKYIEKTIHSCLNQTYENIEVLLLDNASSDRTIKIAKGIQAQDSRLQIFEGEINVGPYNGLNFLLEKADGEYIAIQDHDDIWFSEKIEKQVEFLENNEDFIACGTNTFYYYESKKILILSKKPFDTDFVDHTSLMFRNNGFRYDSLNVLSDLHFEKKILLKSGKIACLEYSVAVHRIRNDANNLSLCRFKFNYKNLVEYFLLNVSIYDLMNFLFVRYLPESVVWFIRKKITLRKAVWMSRQDFTEKFSEINI